MIKGYCRVSKDKQDIGKYIEQLRVYGIDEENIYQDTKTGTKRDREGLNKLLEGLQEGDIVIINDMTRLGRSTIDLLNIVDEIKSKGAFIKSLKESWLDTTTDNPQGQLMLTMFSGLAQYERDLIGKPLQKIGTIFCKKR